MLIDTKTPPDAYMYIPSRPRACTIHSEERKKEILNQIKTIKKIITSEQQTTKQTKMHTYIQPISISDEKNDVFVNDYRISCIQKKKDH